LSAPSPGIDRRLARRRFERAAPTYRRASRLEAEIGARMLERLDYVKLAPRRILDAGSGPAREAAALLRRYRGASLIALDFSLAMLPRRGILERLTRRGVLAVCADFTRLPIEPDACELVWSNMALHWSEPLAAFREFERVLSPEGLLMFSTLGPDTLKELRAAAGGERVHTFIDMHDLGDMLIAAGFSSPVMDMEILTFTYSPGETLLADLRASGQTCARADRARGLTGRVFGNRLREGLAAAASFEVVYGHAWKTHAARNEAKPVRVFKRIS
jgi:malonyl-CoA O-methyltransferase